MPPILGRVVQAVTHVVVGRRTLLGIRQTHRGTRLDPYLPRSLPWVCAKALVTSITPAVASMASAATPRLWMAANGAQVPMAAPMEASTRATEAERHERPRLGHGR